MINYQAYHNSVVLHQHHVRIAGRWIGGIPLSQLNSHDLSKFSAEEAAGYADWFHGDKNDPDGFDRAWLHHQNHNPHHWEYWITRSSHTGNPDREFTNCLQMPEVYVREMIADWHGASQGFTGQWDISEWYNSRRDFIDLHPKTWQLLQSILTGIGYEVAGDGSIRAGASFSPPSS